jgi:hypothetical protein
LSNKYTQKYYGIIYKAKTESRTKTDGAYYESHHIYPRSLWPELDKEKWNKVLLTAKEHYICHLLLLKMTEGMAKRKMYFAFSKMGAKRSYQERYTSNLYAKHRHYHRDAITGENHWNYKKPLSDEQKEKLRIANLGKRTGKDNPMFGKNFSKEHREKISQGLKAFSKKNPGFRSGRKMPEEQKEKLRLFNIGRKHPGNAMSNHLRWSKHWLVTTPDGTEIEVFNLAKFCRDNGMNSRGDSASLGKGKYKGYTAIKTQENK